MTSGLHFSRPNSGDPYALLTSLHSYADTLEKWARGVQLPAAIDPAPAMATATAATSLLGSATFTSPVTITATAEASATTVVTAPAVTCNGVRTVVVSFQALYWASASGTNNTANLVLFDGSTSLGMIGRAFFATAGQSVGPVYTATYLVPSAGSHTFSIRGWASSFQATVGAGSGGSGNDRPGLIRVEQI